MLLVNDDEDLAQWSYEDVALGNNMLQRLCHENILLKNIWRIFIDFLKIDKDLFFSLWHFHTFSENWLGWK